MFARETWPMFIMALDSVGDAGEAEREAAHALPAAIAKNRAIAIKGPAMPRKRAAGLSSIKSIKFHVNMILSH